MIIVKSNWCHTIARSWFVWTDSFFYFIYHSFFVTQEYISRAMNCGLNNQFTCVFVCHIPLVFFFLSLNCACVHKPQNNIHLMSFIFNRTFYILFFIFFFLSYFLSYVLFSVTSLSLFTFSFAHFRLTWNAKEGSRGGNLLGSALMGKF